MILYASLLILISYLFGLFVFPVLFSFFSSLLSIFFINKKNYIFIALVFSIFFVFFGMAMDPVSYVGDYSRYYLSFYRPMEQILVTGKIYRFSIFSFLQFFDMGPQFYTGISLFLNYLITSVISIKFALILIGNNRKVIVLTFLLSVMAYPSTAIGNFESMLSFNVIYMAFYFLVTKRNSASLILLLMAPLIHPAAIPLSLLMLLPVLSFKVFNKVSFLVMVSAVVSISAFVITPLDFVHPFLGHIQRKLVNFLTGPWSEYIERRDYEFIIIAVVKILVSVYILIRFSKIRKSISSSEVIYFDNVISIAKYLLPIMSLCLVSRTLAERYIYFGMFYYIPLLMIGMTVIRLKVNKVFVFSVCSLVLLLPQNIIVFGVISTKSYTEETIDMNIIQLIHHEYDRAPDPVGRI